MTTFARRDVLKAGALLPAALALPACSKSEAATTEAKPGASTGAVAGNATKPEVSDLRIGIIALTDNSPLVIAHEKGFFKKYGINATIVKGASWAAIRDSLSNGDIQATHMLIGMPIASTMGLLGSPKKPMVIPWMLNRNGQAITLKMSLKGKIAADPKALKSLVDEAKKQNTPMTFAMTFHFRAIRLSVLEYLLESGKAKRVAAAATELDQSQTRVKPGDSVQIAEANP